MTKLYRLQSATWILKRWHYNTIIGHPLYEKTENMRVVKDVYPVLGVAYAVKFRWYHWHLFFIREFIESFKAWLKFQKYIYDCMSGKKHYNYDPHSLEEKKIQKEEDSWSKQQ